jgi:hypothetical protein
VRVTAGPAMCSLDFTDGGLLTVNISKGRTLSFESVASKSVRAAPDGSFTTLVPLPPSFEGEWGHAFVSGGFDAHATGDVNLKSVRFRVPD